MSVSAPFVSRCLRLVRTSVSILTGSPEAVTRLRFPQNVACGFPAPRSSAIDSQHFTALRVPVTPDEGALA